MSRWKGLPAWLAALLVMLVAIIWLATTSFPILDKSQIVSGAQLPAVSAGHELIQTIRAPEDTISRVDLNLGKPYPEADGELRFQLVEVIGPDDGGQLQLGEVLREVILDTGSFEYTSRRSFEFESVDVTPGATYALRLTSDDPEDIAAIPGGWLVDNYNGGRVYLDGEATVADLYLGLFHEAGAGGILEKMQPWRPYPLNQDWFIIAMFLIGAATFGWLLWVLAAGGMDELPGGLSGSHTGDRGESRLAEEGAAAATARPGASASGKRPPAGPEGL